MNALSETTTAGAQSIPNTNTNRKGNLSADGKWRSFPKVPNLLQYVVAGTYYARCKVNGKPVRASLETDVFTTAKVRLPDKLNELRKPKAHVGTFADGRIKYETETKNGYTSRKNRLVKLAPLSVDYRLRCLECLRRTLVECLFHPGKTWKELSEEARAEGFAKLDEMNARDFNKEHCDAWQARYSSDYSPSVFNNTVNTFRRVLELAGLPHDDNLAYKIGRMDILEKPIRLPSPEQFDRIINLVETSGAGQSKDCANLIRFLAFTGSRIAEAKQGKWSDVDWNDNTLQIHSVKIRNRFDQDITRIIPLNPALKQLLEKMQQKENPKPTDRICQVSECQKSLDRACKMAECKRLTHHDLRHYFVTKCLQAGVDVFTVAKWVGHKDNGKLLLKVYSHLQAEHSQAMANKVTFGASSVNPVSPVAATESD
ncbi:MAG: site-specific integrase [Verrucomicrobiota bacterium]|jgi:integrase